MENRKQAASKVLQKMLALALGLFLSFCGLRVLAHIEQQQGLKGLIMLVGLGSACGLLSMVVLVLQAPAIKTSSKVTTELEELRERVRGLEAALDEESRVRPRPVCDAGRSSQGPAAGSRLTSSQAT